VVDHVLHFEGGTAVPYATGYESFVQQRQERRLSQQRAFDKQQKVVASEADYIARNIEATRAAYGVDSVEITDYSAKTTATSHDTSSAMLTTAKREKVYSPAELAAKPTGTKPAMVTRVPASMAKA